MATAGVLTAALMVSACKGLPEAPNLKYEMTKSLNVFGMEAFYPISEAPRVGQIYLVDVSVDPNIPQHPLAENRVLLSDGLVEAFESKRSTKLKQRYAKSDNGKPDNDLMLSAFPGFKLASIDQAALTTFIPQKVASFLAAVGLRQERSLNMYVKNVEVAALPLEDLVEVISNDCSNRQGTTLLSFNGRNTRATNLLKAGLMDLEDFRKRRQLLEGRELPEVDPVIVLISQVYYLRSISYSLDASDVSATQLQAAVTQQFPQSHPPPSITNVFVNPTTASTTADKKAETATTASTASDTKAQSEKINLSPAITSVTEDLSRQAAVATGTNAQVAGSFIRATGTGVELVETFERPLAFGYKHYAFKYHTKNEMLSNGFFTVCRNLASSVQ